jgi:uncharacterized protein
MKLPDTNVLIYATNRDAPQQAVAAAWLEEAFNGPAGVGLAWAALLGFIRICTRPGILQRPLNVEQALQAVDVWVSHPAARVLHPGDRHAALLGRLLIGAGTAGNLTSDAHLAALAMEHGATLGSFDKDFARFGGLAFEPLGA